MNEFLIGLQFLTRIFVVKQSVWTEKSFGESVKFFPAVGAVLGMLSALVVATINLFSMPIFTGAVGFASLIVLTGGIHCDGLMDSADGLFSGREREKILEIMKDSRSGAFGVVSFVLISALEVSTLAELANFSTIQLCAPIIARMMMVVTIGAFPYAKSVGMGKSFAKFTTRRTIIISAAETLILLLPLNFFGEKLFLCALAAILTAFLTSWRFSSFAKSKIGGVTGDIYGAVTILSEMVVMITFLLVGTIL